MPQLPVLDTIPLAHSSARPNCITVKTTLAKSGPSTHSQWRNLRASDYALDRPRSAWTFGLVAVEDQTMEIGLRDGEFVAVTYAASPQIPLIFQFSIFRISSPPKEPIVLGAFSL